jgi:hypothetical protein
VNGVLYRGGWYCCSGCTTIAAHLVVAGHEAEVAKRILTVRLNDDAVNWSLPIDTPRAARQRGGAAQSAESLNVARDCRTRIPRRGIDVDITTVCKSTTKDTSIFPEKKLTKLRIAQPGGRRGAPTFFVSKIIPPKILHFFALDRAYFRRISR